MSIIFGVQIFMKFPPKHAFYLTVYLTVTCEPVLGIEDGPLKFWKDSKEKYPRLAKLANTLPFRHLQLLLKDCSVLADQTGIG